MARSRTFADGEILTPADVNDHLVNHVPSPGAAFDTGWVTFSTGDAVVVARRVGMTVTVHVTLYGSWPGNVFALHGGSPVMGVDMAPYADAQGVGRGDKPGIGTFPIMAFVGANRSITFIKDPAITEYISASITYVVA